MKLYTFIVLSFHSKQFQELNIIFFHIQIYTDMKDEILLQLLSKISILSELSILIIDIEAFSFFRNLQQNIKNYLFLK